MKSYTDLEQSKKLAEILPLESADMHDKLTAFESSLKHIIEEAIECGDTHNLKADADMLLRLAQKPWSEEDEDILNTIINHFKVDIECTDEDDIVRWLKSLKERIKKE